MANEKRLIDANSLVEFLKEQKDKETGAYSKGRNNGINVAIGAIRNEEICHTVDAVEVVHGEWIMCLDVDDVEFIECPLCGSQFYDGDNDTFDKPYNYCPNCGAKMDGDENG